MSPLIRGFLTAGLIVCLPLAHVAGGENDGKSATKTRPSRPTTGVSSKSPSNSFPRSTSWTPPERPS